MKLYNVNIWDMYRFKSNKILILYVQPFNIHSDFDTSNIKGLRLLEQKLIKLKKSFRLVIIYSAVFHCDITPTTTFLHNPPVTDVSPHNSDVLPNTFSSNRLLPKALYSLKQCMVENVSEGNVWLVGKRLGEVCGGTSGHLLWLIDFILTWF